MVRVSSLAILVILLSVGLVSAEDHYVTQSGAGSFDGSSVANAFSVSQFNNPSNWDRVLNSDNGKIGPGDTVFFSGTISVSVEVTSGGSSGGNIVLDGYNKGDCDALNDNCINGALLGKGIDIGVGRSGPDYLIIQDFRITNPTSTNSGTGVVIQGDDRTGSSDAREINHLVVQRNYIHDTHGGLIGFSEWAGAGPYSHIIIRDNKMVNYGQNDGDPAQGMNIAGINHALISHNMIGHDEDGTILGEGAHPSGLSSSNVIEVHNCEDIVFEYNDIFGAEGAPCAGIALKEGGEIHRIIFRYNKVHHNGKTSPGKGIGISWGGGDEDKSEFYAYCNFVYSNSQTGIRSHDNGDDAYWWSNLVVNHLFNGYQAHNRDGKIPDNVRITNNVFYHNGDDASDPFRSGMFLSGGTDHIIENNIFLDNRPSGHASRYQQLMETIGNTFTLKSNTYFHRLGTPLWYYDGNYRTLDYMQNTAGQESGSEIRNPSCTDADGNDNVVGTDDDDLTLKAGSLEIDSGLKLTTELGSVDVSGGDRWFEELTGYSTIKPTLSEALHPDTDWTRFPSPQTIITADQNVHGTGWERGAYVYAGGQASFSCTGSIPPNAASFDSEESTGLTTNTPWTYSATDTTKKCEYYCNTGYTVDGSACIFLSANTLAILKAQSPITLDGNLKEFMDAKSIVLTNSRGTIGTYKFLWDNEHLYLAAEVSDNGLNSVNTADESDLFNDDSMELMFDTANNGGGLLDSDDYKFFINTLNAKTDRKRLDDSWDSGIESIVIATGTNKDDSDRDEGYIIEARIPFQSWATPSVGTQWGMNLALNDKHASGIESTLWSGTSMNSPDDAGTITFSSTIAQSRCSAADTNSDGKVSMPEVMGILRSWRGGILDIQTVIMGINEWKNGC